ncbi:RAD24/Rf-C activator 1 AAA+ ATPase [Cryptosporidium canis]|uniref:RAD24/Rf-C activator 1 AAA+ ATPase n=1 Tax=Cryptosporidium canis TaxID=195482 RepID=A0A9D5DIL4_9CRYT|nr:RAD24/Rf-C activator 1 AAA+ ATPase [Cryptosporidium canis]
MSLWTNTFGPQTPQELSINKNKIIEVRGFLDCIYRDIDSDYNSRKSILIIIGPAGTGKTTVLRCLCKHKFKILEWEPPIFNEGLGASFHRFIFNSIFFSRQRLNEHVLILIKDLPLTLLKNNSTSLVEIRYYLSELLQNSSFKIPVVFITGEDRSERQFLKLIIPGEVDIFNENYADKKFARYTKIVRLNPVPSTIIKSKLKFILNIKKISVGRFEEGIIEKIVQTSNGDLAHAISQLQFFFEGSPETYIRGGVHCPQFSSEMSSSIRKRKNSLSDTDQITKNLDLVFGKEPLYNLFRTIGRILYNKREAVINKSESEHFNKKRTKIITEYLNSGDSNTQIFEEETKQRSYLRYFSEGFKGMLEDFIDLRFSKGEKRGRLSFDVEDLLLYSGVEDNSLVLLLQENYIPFVGNSIDTIVCSSIFSWSDVYTNYLDPDQFSSTIVSCVARTILYFNSNPLNPCSSDHQAHSDLKVGFSKNQFSLWEKQGSFKSKELVPNSKKVAFKWHPKKPALKTFTSCLEALREEYKSLITKCLFSFCEVNCTYLLLNKTMFTEILPYLNYFSFKSNGLSLNTTNNELIKFANVWSKYYKYAALPQLNFKGVIGVGLESDQILNSHDNSSISYSCDYLSDEQLVSILETYDVESLHCNSTTNNHLDQRNSNISDLTNPISSSDSIDDSD